MGSSDCGGSVGGEDDDVAQGEDALDLIGVNWDFNAYGGPEGGCYWPCELDRAIATNVVDHLNRSHPQITFGRRDVDLVLEGGSIHVDGQGTVLATEECLLNPNRNPHFTREEIEAKVLGALGYEGGKFVWIPHGLAHDDDTNGHVDNIAAFIRPGEVVLSWTDDAVNDADNYRRCRAAEEALLRQTDAMGRRLRVHRLPLPHPMHYTEEEVVTISEDEGAVPRKAGERLAASYANFYVANRAVVVPMLGDDIRDEEALRVLQDLFPGRTVVGVPGREILLGGGNVHCITQQVPQP